MVEEELDLYMV